jgi:hypothetical protein
MTQEGCRQLGIVHLVGQVTRLMLDELQILTGGVQDGNLSGPTEALPQTGEIQGQGIEQGKLLAIVDLEQTELGIVGTGANEFGIDGQGTSAREARY